jgi:uncharacterized protein YndB with AHSA1/START domain
MEGNESMNVEKVNVEKSIWIAAPRDRVWQALTDPEHLAQWFLPPALGAQLQREADGRLSVLMGPMAVGVAMFEGFDAPRRFTSRSLPDNLLTTTYTLEDADGGTHVTIKVSGLESLPADAAQDRVEPLGAGWEKALQNLKAYLAGENLPHPEGYIAAMYGYRREAKQIFAVERSIWLKAPIERVWEAVTDPDQIQQWYSPGAPWRLSALEVGGRLYSYDAETNTDSHVQVIEVLDPPLQLVLRAQSEGAEPEHVITYRLAEENGGTRFTLTDAGYEREADAHSTMEQNAFGFGMVLENLRAYLEGSDLPYPWGF